MKSIWVVERGSYSDYRVVGVFTSKEKAELIAKAVNSDSAGSYDDATVAEWPLDPAVAELQKGYRQYRVLMLHDGTVEKISPEDGVSSYDLSGSVSILRRTEARAYQGTNTPDVMRATVWAKNETHAIKIGNEKRARLIADGQW